MLGTCAVDDVDVDVVDDTGAVFTVPGVAGDPVDEVEPGRLPSPPHAVSASDRQRDG